MSHELTASTNSNHHYRHEALHKLSRGVLAVTQETSQGSYVIANDTLKPGQLLLECPSASIALDPPYRLDHCGYCAGSSPKPCCTECHVITICRNCHEKGVSKWHTQSGECHLLSSLVDGFGRVFSEFKGQTRPQTALGVESIYILTLRLVHRRQTKQFTCPLPPIDWKLFDLLYTSPLPPTSSSGLTTAMASLLQAINSSLQETQQQSPIDPQECLSVWNKCRGCCHAITDLTRPLGAQSLGMALFVPQSFYNHACAPNAFLSCWASDCAVASRVQCCHDDNSKGDPVSLSYIPLSGLCRRERRMRLKENYNFVCQCGVCEASDLEESVGGELAAMNDEEWNQIMGPLRELQIECHQNLIAASTMDGEERTDCVEQCVATLRMAQRGIRNNKIPSSHEVALECHRLLAVANALLRGIDEDAINEEWNHHEEFLKAASKIQPILDPSALAIQHSLAAVCLQHKLTDKDVKNRDDMSKQQHFHSNEATRLATMAVGKDHPFVASLQLPEAETHVESNKKRKLDENFA